MGRKLRAVARNGRTFIIRLPPDVDPLTAYDVLTRADGREVDADWHPGLWLETEDGDRVRADVIEELALVDKDEPARRRVRGTGARAGALLLAGLLGAVGAAPVEGAKALMRNEPNPKVQRAHAKPTTGDADEGRRSAGANAGDPDVGQLTRSQMNTLARTLEAAGYESTDVLALMARWQAGELTSRDWVTLRVAVRLAATTALGISGSPRGGEQELDPNAISPDSWSALAPWLDEGAELDA